MLSRCFTVKIVEECLVKSRRFVVNILEKRLDKSTLTVKIVEKRLDKSILNRKDC